MTIIITIIILIIIFTVFTVVNCSNSYRTVSGRMYRARDHYTAELLDFLQVISIDLSYNIKKDFGKLLRKKLQNTTFIELMFVDPRILGWNYDKGREIGLKMYKITGEAMASEEIIHTLFHELAHSMTKEMHHPPGGEWEYIDGYLQTFSPKYVKIYNKKKELLIKKNE